MLWYIGLYILGLAAAVVSPIAAVEKTLGLIGPITLTALVASLLVPFAGFTSKEGWQKWAVQFGIVPLFGCYTVLVWHYANMVGFLLLAGATIVHFGYWTSSIHSRSYRLKMFEMAFAKKMPGLTQLIARLHVARKADVADRIITTLLKSGKVYGDQVKEALEESGDDAQLKEILDEIGEPS